MRSPEHPGTITQHGRPTAWGGPAAAALLLLGGAGARAADTVRAVVRNGDLVRAAQLRREGDEVYVPFFACGALLGADARWDAGTNRWALKGKTASAQGFLDEPLLTLSGQPILLKAPPRLLAGAPYLSLEALRLLGRHGWDVEVAWDGAARELVLRPAQLAASDTAPRTRAVPVPAVPAGSRAVVLDAGHARHGGLKGWRGLAEGDVGLALAQAAGATLAAVSGVTPVIVQGEGEQYEPSEVASMANAAGAGRFLSFHASEGGAPGIAVWCWELSNILATGITFAPFEPGRAAGPSTWSQAAGAEAPRSLALARRLVRTLAAAGLPARGPFQAPLLPLEGVGCPAAVLDLEGLGTPEGAALALDGAVLARAGAAAGAALREDLGAAVPPGGAP